MSKGEGSGKQITLFLVIAFVALATMAGGCICGSLPGSTTTETATPTASPTAAPTGVNGGSQATTPTAAPATAGEKAPEISYSGENVVVAGSGNGDAKVPLKAGGYVAYSQARSTLQLQEVTSAGAASLYLDGLTPDRSGWLTALKIIHVSEAGEKTFHVTCDGTYEVRFNRLPSSTGRQYLPWTSSGKGTSCTAPMEITVDNVTVSITCKDTMKKPFTAYLVDGLSGENYGVIATGTGPSVDVTKTVAIPKPGLYNVQIDSMTGTDWKVQISK